jgi:hypothetical protein
MMTLILIVWFRKYDQNQDFDIDDELTLKKDRQVLYSLYFLSFKFQFLI